MKYLFLALGILSLTFTFAVSKDIRSGKQINTACMQSAIAVRDNALVLGMKEYTQELESMIETRKFSSIAVWSGNADQYKARDSMNMITTAYQKTVQNEARIWNTKKQEIWREYIENSKQCGKKDTVTSRIDMYL
jgi:hypothetical protein